MEAKNIKSKILIINYLNSKGFSPDSINRHHYYYVSPFRKENTASFHVNNTLNVWYDFGQSRGGNVIDLCMSLENVSFHKACKILENVPQNQIVSVSFQQNNFIGKQEIMKAKHIENKALIDYLHSRKITLLNAVKHCQEVYFTANGKTYFALGFKNDSSGWELRNKYFKGGTAPKDITTIETYTKSKTNGLNVFEGFIDFLSAVEHFGTMRNKTIVLNSIVNIRKSETLIKSAEFVNSFLDNDNAGVNAFEALRKLNENTVNKSAILYPNYKDFNEYICKL